MNKIKKIIIILFIVIIMIFLILVGLLKNSETEENNEITNNETINAESNDEVEQETNNDTFQIVKDNSDFYGISTVIDNFCEYSNIVYTGEYVNQGSMIIDEELTDEDKQVYIDMLMDMLSNTYIEEFNITDNNIESSISYFAESDYDIESMYYYLGENNVTTFMVYGDLTETKSEYNFMITVDLDTNAFEIYLDDYISKYNYTEENISKLEVNSNNIELNDNNKFSTISYSDQDMAAKYLSDYKNILSNDLEEAYNILDQEYKEKKFDSYEEFTEYYEDRKNGIFSYSLENYEVTEYNSYTKYICVDSYGNYYIFYATGVMNYTVMLDQYTIFDETVEEEYNNATDEQKVQTDIDIFFKMVNTKDYVSAYKLLNNSFKNNYFSTIDEFKEYAQNNFFESTTITTVNELTQSGSYYVCTIVTSNDMSDTVETGEETFIVSLGEDTDFEMSFTVKE